MSTQVQREARKAGGWLSPVAARALKERNAEIIRSNYDMRERIRELAIRLEERDAILDRLLAARVGTDAKVEA